MLITILTRLGYAELLPPLARYLIMISIVGPVAGVLLLATGIERLTVEILLLTAMLVALAAAAERFPLHLTHKANINMATAAYVAAILLLPTTVPGAVALVAASIAQRLRQADRVEALFNIGQTTLYVTIAALTYGMLDGWQIGPAIGPFGSVGAIVGMAAVLHLLNTGLVSLAGALQLALRPLRVWWVNLGLDLMPHVALTMIGVIAASVATTHPLVVPLLALPAVLVHNAVRQSVQLRADTHEALASLVEVLEIRDPYTAGHSRRVAMIARILALRLGLTAEEADLIEQAGRVHDIGKTAVDTHVLTKSGALTDAEWAQMRLHPVHGANVVEHFTVYRQSVPLIRHHHESWDGTGYPDGLAGEAIPFGARILAVADTFDALTSDRPYRVGMTVEQAISILEAGAGTQWDPRIVAAMHAYLQETAGEIPSYRPVAAPPPRTGDMIAAPRGAGVIPTVLP